MNKDILLQKLQQETVEYNKISAAENGDWINR